MSLFSHETRQGLVNGGLVDRLVASRIQPGQGLVINGFWRSGTTFLLEQAARRLRAKPLFEPLDIDVPGYAALLDDWRPAGRPASAFDRYFMPHALSPGLARHIEQALTYRLIHPSVQRARTNLTAHGRRPPGMPDWLAQQGLASRRRVVVKCVRASLLLPALIDTYDLPVIHIRRRPEAVLASFQTVDWSAFAPERLNLRALLLEVDDGRRVFFDRFADLIAELDRGPADDRLIGYWALTECFVACHVAAERIISYEALALGQLDLGTCLRAQGLSPRGEVRVGFNSSTTTAERAHLSARQRAEGWREQLGADAVARVGEIVVAVQAVEPAFTLD